MTNEQALRLASRLVVVYLLCWVLSDLSSLPQEIFSVYEAWNFPATGGDGTYLRREILFLASNVLRIGMWLTLSLRFYQCGPQVRGWFGLEQTVESAEVQTTMD